MYIKTPKRYRGTQRRRVFSCGRIFMSLMMLALIIVGVALYYNRDMFQPYAVSMVETAIVDVNHWQATTFAPTPEPTRDPSRTLIDADNEWARGRVSLAMQSYSDILEVLPNNVQVHSRMTEAYIARGDTENMLDFAEKTVTADPFSADAWAIRSLAYSWENDVAQGIASAQQALAIDPNHVQATAFLAYAYREGGQSSLAEIRANDAIAADPNRWEGYWVRGIIRENDLFDFAGALDDFQTAYELALDMGQNPAMAGIIATGVSRILIRPEYRDYDGAIGILNASLELDPNNSAVLYALGYIEFSQIGDYAQAQEAFLDCTQVDPSNYLCWYFLGRSRNSLGDQEGALQAFQEAIELDTPHARHYWWAANLEQALGSCAEASIYLQTGYSMVMDGGLPAIDEGNASLIEDFDYSISICRVNVAPSTEVEATEESG